MEGRYKTEGPFSSEFKIHDGEVRRVSDWQMFPDYKGPPLASEAFVPAEVSDLHRGCTIGCLTLSVVGIPYLGYLVARKAWENRPVMPWEAKAVTEADKENRANLRRMK